MIGDDRFVERVVQTSAADARFRDVDLERIVAYVCKGIGVTEQQLARAGKERSASDARALVGWLAATTRAATLTEVARRFKRDLSAVSRAVARVERLAAEDPAKGKILRTHQIAISQA